MLKGGRFVLKGGSLVSIEGFPGNETVFGKKKPPAEGAWRSIAGGEAVNGSGKSLIFL